uniref:Putative Flp pilus-assembly TadG-like N-terminal domain-containing protein n=1 Tax=Actinoplanes liguriensis TaxID=69484 RepID=D8V3M7_ACTLG|nr:hypothetical protein [Actinoplanes liguriensis]
MRRLIHALFPPRGEHGVITALVAVLAGAGVLLGMAALVIDIGALYAEREQLQSGADAASWKVAQACAGTAGRDLTSATCTVAAQRDNAQRYADRNAKDLVSDVQFCITTVSAAGVTTADAGCPSSWNTPVTCPAPPSASGPYRYVEVRTSTRNSDNTSVVPPLFGRGLAGSAYHGAKMGACGRVAWGAPAVTDVLALGVSRCDFLRLTGDYTRFFAPPPPTGPNPQTGVHPLLGLSDPTAGYIPISDGILATSCPADAGETVAGYTWLGQPDGPPALPGLLPVSAPDASCELTGIPATDGPADSWVGGFTIGPGNASAATACLDRLNVLITSGQPVLVPIFDRQVAVIGTLPSYYRIAGFAPLVLTGYESPVSGPVSPGSAVPSLVPGAQRALCAAQSCLYGYFTRALVTDHVPTRFATSRYYGAMVIGRTG